jgi:hypothetical protein
MSTPHFTSSSYQNEQSKVLALRKEGFVPGVRCSTSGPFPYLIIAGLVMDSDNLSVQILTMDPESQCFLLSNPKGLKVLETTPAEHKIDCVRLATSDALMNISQACPPENLMNLNPKFLAQEGTLSGYVSRHYKGGIYTVVAALGISSSHPTIIYVSHDDGTWWSRNWSEFVDGRFDPSDEETLTMSELGLSAVINGTGGSGSGSATA